MPFGEPSKAWKLGRHWRSPGKWLSGIRRFVREGGRGGTFRFPNPSAGAAHKAGWGKRGLAVRRLDDASRWERRIRGTRVRGGVERQGGGRGEGVSWGHGSRG